MSGSGIIEAEVFRTEQVSRLARTSDPSSPPKGDAWIRTDVQPTSDSVAALRIQGDSGYLEAPLFDPSASTGSDVYVGQRFLFDDGTEGHLLVTESGGVGSPRVVTSGGTEYQAHDSLSAIPVIDDFEDGDISEYSGDTGNATVQTSTVYNGSYALQFDTGGGFQGLTSTSGLTYPSRGDTFEWYWQHSAVSTSSGMAWAVSAAPYESNDAYAFAIRGDSKDTVELRRYDGGSRTTLASKSYDVPSGSWYKAWVDFQDTITCEVRDLNDNTQVSISATDSNYDSGGIGWRLNDKTGSSSTAYNDYARIL